MRKKPADALDMGGFALVRGAGERQFLVIEMETLEGTGPHHRQRLHRLDRRAREHRASGVAGASNHPAGGIADDEGGAVAVLYPAPAAELDQYGVGVQERKSGP